MAQFYRQCIHAGSLLTYVLASQRAIGPAKAEKGYVMSDGIWSQSEYKSVVFQCALLSVCLAVFCKILMTLVGLVGGPVVRRIYGQRVHFQTGNVVCILSLRG